MCHYLQSSVLWCPLWFPHKNLCLVRLYLKLFAGVLMSYLCYLCLFAHSGVQHILCCVFLLLCFQFLWIVHFWLPLWFIHRLYAKNYYTKLTISVVFIISDVMSPLLNVKTCKVFCVLLPTIIECIWGWKKEWLFSIS